MSEQENLEKVAHELVKAVRSVTWVGYTVWAAIFAYLALIFAVEMGSFLLRHLDVAAMIILCSAAFILWENNK
jgi:hypothetical protein